MSKAEGLVAGMGIVNLVSRQEGQGGMKGHSRAAPHIRVIYMDT